MTMDTVNGCLELGGALITLLSVRQLLRDRRLMGAHWGPTIFFTLWGIWNLAYYPSLAQPVSTVGAGLLVVVNALYLSLMLRYRPRGGRGELRLDGRVVGHLTGVRIDVTSDIVGGAVPEAYPTPGRLAAIRTAGERMRAR